ncbi:MAG: hypothetical protein ABI399_07125 [Bauldia sp.]
MNGVVRLGGDWSLSACLRFCACLVVLFLPLPALAQQASAGLQGEFDQVYQRLLTDPADRALNRRMIEIAVAMKDYDAAIGAVERLIFYEPANVALQIEAARLYLEIDSYAAARGYLTDALAIPSISPALRKQAEALVAKIENDTKPKGWSALVQTGFRYQTNANISCPLPCATENAPVEGVMPDWNSFALGSLGLAEPVGKNLVLEASASAYYADQFKINRLDLGFAELNVGARIRTSDDRLSIKPYSVTQGILLGSDPYQLAYGGGVIGHLGLGEDWSIEPQFEYKHRRFYNSDDYASATTQTGDIFTYAASLNGQFSERSSLALRGGYSKNYATEDYQSFDQYFASLGLTFGFDIFGWKNWTFGPFATASFTQYKAPDPADPVEIMRKDFLWSVGANLEMPLTEKASLGFQVQYTKSDSTRQRFTYDNFSFLFGPVGRF